MELLKLSVYGEPKTLVEGYDSLIWTERFNQVGDFELVTSEVSRFMSLLHEGVWLSLRETNHTMIVETHRIERKKNAGEKLTITGRSAESILDRRISQKDLGTAPWSKLFVTPSDAAYSVINDVCIDGVLSNRDRFDPAVVYFPPPIGYGTFDPPYRNGPLQVIDIPRQSLLQTVLELIQTEAPPNGATTPVTPAFVPHGIRGVRPNATGSGIAVEIYMGEDRSEEIYFDARRDLLDDGTYLFSKVGSANVSYVTGDGVSGQVHFEAGEPLGFSRRVTATKVDGLTDPNGVRLEGARALSKARTTAIFDGMINQDLNPYLYGRDYNLGDTVKLVGDYGMSSIARVTEYIRSEDAAGHKAYPTLQTITGYY